MAARASDLPMPGVIGVDTREAIGKAQSTEETIEVVNLHRDERDVRLLLYLASSSVVLVLLLLSSLAVNFWQYYRRPDRIVVDRRADGDHVVTVNDRAINGAVTVGPDKPGEEDKRRLANEWAMARYAVDPVAREQAIEKLLRMMEPTAAQKFVTYLKRNGELERERGERQRAAWKATVTAVDSLNPYRINIVGTQELDKVTGGVPQHESRQVMFSLKLMPDRDSGRAAHNLFTGYLVTDLLDVREVANAGNTGESVLPQQPQH